MGFYKLGEVWLCKLSIVERGSSGILELKEFEPSYLLIEINQDHILTSEEVPEFKSFISGEEYYNGVNKGVFNVSDIGKTFVTEKIQLPLSVLEPDELLSGTVSEERLHSLYKMLFGSKLLG